MRKYIILFFSALLFLFACKWDSTPKGILKPDDMIKVLTAVHLVDGTISTINGQTPDSLYKYGRGRYQAMFKRMHTDTAQFTRSLRYYSQRPEQFGTMYEQVVNNLQAKDDSLIKPTPLPKTNNALPKK